MRIGIVGIGGVGGFYGGKLARAYPPGGEHEIVFLARGAHMQAIRESGLRVITRQGEFVARPSLVSDSPAELGSLDVALFCVKGYDLPSAAAAMKPAVRPDTVIVPLGNGVNNDEIILRALGTGDCLNGCVYISTHIEAPGVVEQTGGNCKLRFGSPAGVMEPYYALESVFRQADIDATLSAHILADVWMKFVFIDPVSGVTSLYACTIGEVLADAERRSLLERLMCEAAAVARARGVDLPGDVVQQSMAMAGAFPADTRSSMQLDVEAGRRTELDTMLGFVVREGVRLGVPTPAHSNVYEALRQVTA